MSGKAFGSVRLVTGMRRAHVFIAAGSIAVLPSCSPVYSFRIPPRVLADALAAPLAARLDAFLESKGFEPLGQTDRATGDIGCGRNAADRSTFEKEWRDSGFVAEYHWVWVHQFSCKGEWQVMIVSSTNAEREAAELRDALSSEFSPEISSGTMRVETRHRFALE